MKVELRINRTKTGQRLSSTNVNFEIRPVTCTKTEPKNDLFFNCRTKTKELSKKELLNVAPASLFKQRKLHFWQSGSGKISSFEICRWFFRITILKKVV